MLPVKTIFAGIFSMIFMSSADLLFSQTTEKQRQQYMASVLDSVYAGIKRKFDYRWTAAPFYSNEKGFGASFSSSLLYNSDKRRQYDSIQQLSSISLDLEASIRGHFKGTFSGEHHSSLTDGKMIYTLGYAHSPEPFMEPEGIRNSIPSEFNKTEIFVWSAYLFRINASSYAGPETRASLIYAYNTGSATADHRYADIRYGIFFNTDTRDNKCDASKGYTVTIRPAFRNINGSGCFHMEFSSSVYFRLWKNGILAAELHADTNFGNIPWILYPAAGGDSRIRGYRYGYYRYKSIISLQTELRQKIYRRHSAAIWVSAGACTSDFTHMDRFLPSTGAGYRFAVTNDLKIRIDYGIGKYGEQAVIIGINEAF